MQHFKRFGVLILCTLVKGGLGLLSAYFAMSPSKYDDLLIPIVFAISNFLESNKSPIQDLEAQTVPEESSKEEGNETISD